MISQPKRTTIVLNLLVLIGIIWLYYFENNPVVHVPTVHQPLTAQSLVETRPAEPLESSIENSIKMTTVVLPAPPLQTAKPAQREKRQNSTKLDNSVLWSL